MAVQIPVYASYAYNQLPKSIVLENPNPIEVQAKVETPLSEETAESETVEEVNKTDHVVDIDEKLSTNSEVEEYIYEVFGEDAERGIKMLKECENKSMNPEAVNWNGNGTFDAGTWQINSMRSPAWLRRGGTTESL